MDQARRNDSGSIDHDADHVTLGFSKAPVDRPCRRWRCRIEPDESKLARQPLEDLRADWGGRPIVNNDHLIIMDTDVLLVSSGERQQGTWEFPRDIVGDDDDRHPWSTPSV